MAKAPKKSSKGRTKPRTQATSARAAKNNGRSASVIKRKPSAPPEHARAKMNSKAVAAQAEVMTMQPTQPGKPVKNQAGLKSKDLEFFRRLLLAKRHELLGDVSSMEEEALRNGGGSNLSNLPIHMADMGTDNYEQEFTLNLVQKDRDMLNEIDSALAKIRNGMFGICEGTGKPISRARLEAKPWAKYSIEYARQLEKGLVRG